ncbi:hypothetical protein KFE25_001110 [Diacronema lutheri]|uniref:Tudor domain-containing protein n=1 Tax=Diacronema lutheri TaxID=2081491 RepID=A0A8J5X9S8_DIALT|nr:hypothetical protein KFE25_001110 [Diacronema lutheri]
MQDRTLARADVDNVAFFRALEQQYEALERELSARQRRHETPVTISRGSLSRAPASPSSSHATPARATGPSARSTAAGRSSNVRAASAARRPRARPPSAAHGAGGARGIAEALRFSRQQGRSASPYERAHSGRRVRYGAEEDEASSTASRAASAESMHGSLSRAHGSAGAGVLAAVAEAVGTAPDAQWARAAVRDRLSAMAPGMAREASLVPELLRATLLLGMLGSSAGAAADAHGAHHDSAHAAGGNANADAPGSGGGGWIGALRTIAPLLYADAVIVFAADHVDSSAGLAPYAGARVAGRPASGRSPLALYASWTRGGRALGSAAAVATTVARRALESRQPVLIDASSPNSLFDGCALAVPLPPAAGKAASAPCGVLLALRWHGGSPDASGTAQFAYPPDTLAVGAIIAAALVPALSAAQPHAQPRDSLARHGGDLGSAQHGGDLGSAQHGGEAERHADAAVDGGGDVAHRPPLPHKTSGHTHGRRADAPGSPTDAQPTSVSQRPPPAARAPPAAGAFAAGERVLADWRGHGSWYGGVIHAVASAAGGPEPSSSVSQDVCYDVCYDDGAFEAGVPLSRVRKEPEAAAAGAARAELPPDASVREAPLGVGTRVLADWKGEGTLFFGHVSAVAPDGVRGRGHGRSYTISYDDGDVEDAVPPERVRQATISGRSSGAPQATGPLTAVASRAARDAAAAAAAEHAAEMAHTRAALGEQVGSVGKELAALSAKIERLEAETAAERTGAAEAVRSAAERADAALRASEAATAAAHTATRASEALTLSRAEGDTRAQSASRTAADEARADAARRTLEVSLHALVKQAVESALELPPEETRAAAPYGGGGGTRGVRSALRARTAGQFERRIDDADDDDGGSLAEPRDEHSRWHARAHAASQPALSPSRVHVEPSASAQLQLQQLALGGLHFAHSSQTSDVRALCTSGSLGSLEQMRARRDQLRARLAALESLEGAPDMRRAQTVIELHAARAELQERLRRMRGSTPAVAPRARSEGFLGPPTVLTTR